MIILVLVVVKVAYSRFCSRKRLGAIAVRKSLQLRTMDMLCNKSLPVLPTKKLGTGQGRNG
jgi:hypothetical protein